MNKSVPLGTIALALGLSSAAIAQDSALALMPGVADCTITPGDDCIASSVFQDGSGNTATVTQGAP